MTPEERAKEIIRKGSNDFGRLYSNGTVERIAAEEIREAIAATREEDARIAENWGPSDFQKVMTLYDAKMDIAAAIRRSR